MPPSISGRPSGRLIIVAYQRSSASDAVDIAVLFVDGVYISELTRPLPPVIISRPSVRKVAVEQKLSCGCAVRLVWWLAAEVPSAGSQRLRMRPSRPAPLVVLP